MVSKTSKNKMRVFIFPQLLSETFLTLRRTGVGINKNVYWASDEVTLFLSDLMKFEFSRQILEKYSNIKFHKSPSNGSRVLCGRTDGYNEANSRFS